jgi:hypothetical protein
MSENNEVNHPELFSNLSEAEQESLTAGQSLNIVGGSNFYFQVTNIETEANSNLNLAGVESGTQNTKYKFSQVTIASSTTFTLPNTSRGRNNLFGKFLGRLFS